MVVNPNSSFRSAMATHALGQSRIKQECARKGGEGREGRNGGRKERKKEDRKEGRMEDRDFADILLEHGKDTESHYLFIDFAYSEANHQS